MEILVLVYNLMFFISSLTVTVAAAIYIYKNKKVLKTMLDDLNGKPIKNDTPEE